jgi:hypothetical protein
MHGNRDKQVRQRKGKGNVVHVYKLEIPLVFKSDVRSRVKLAAEIADPERTVNRPETGAGIIGVKIFAKRLILTAAE